MVNKTYIFHAKFTNTYKDRVKKCIQAKLKEIDRWREHKKVQWRI